MNVIAHANTRMRNPLPEFTLEITGPMPGVFLGRLVNVWQATPGEYATTMYTFDVTHNQSVPDLHRGDQLSVPATSITWMRTDLA